MEPMTWYLGPAGNLKPLVCPEPNIRTTEVRYGGIHQGLSGARSMDVTGLKAEYTFNWEFLDATESKWLRALHTRLVPGPFFLLNPMRKNRLSIQAASMSADYSRYTGVLVNGSWQYVYDVPAGLDEVARSFKWTGRTSGGVLRFDQGKGTPVFVGENVTGSVYMKAASACTMRVVIDWLDRNGSQISSEPYVSVNLTTSWQRFSISAAVPSGAFLARFAMYELTGASFPDTYVVAPQFEEGATPTDWEHGGGAVMVLIDQLESSSPKYPYTDCTLTLLEA